MPPTFPSHMGLVAPLWRRWPRHFDITALCVGAVMPDVIDGVALLYHGTLGQGLGHSLLGFFLLCIPGGVLLWHLVHWVAKKAPTPAAKGVVLRAWTMGVTAIREAAPSTYPVRYWPRVTTSVALGAFSHLFFDMLSHGEHPWFYPWHTSISIYPDWWHTAWTHLPLPLYPTPYPVGPHLLVWIVLGVLGAYLLFRPLLKSRRKSDPM